MTCLNLLYHEMTWCIPTMLIITEEMESTVKADDELFWATDVCTLYKPVGQANFPHASGRYLSELCIFYAVVYKYIQGGGCQFN